LKQVEIGIKGRPFTIALDVPDDMAAQSIITTVKEALLSGEIIQTESGPLYLNPARSAWELFDYILIQEPKVVNITVATPQEKPEKFTPGVPYQHKIRTEYLGNKVVIDTVILDTPNAKHNYYLPLTINDKPPLMMLDCVNLRHILHEWNDNQRTSLRVGCNVFDPVGPLAGISPDEAKAFLTDYYENMDLGVKGAPISRAAKAFFGWKDGPEEDQE
jgi:hypothetical protein